MFAQQYRQQLIQSVESIDVQTVQQAIDWFAEAREAGRRIFVCGNGGSASTASHFACDIVKGASHTGRKRFKILALGDSLPTLTAYANDVSYDAVFAEPLRNFAEPGDLVMAISGSGNSPNVLEAIAAAKELGCRTIGLTGRDGGKLAPAVDLNIHVADPHMGRIEDGHMVVCHMICYYFMEER